MFYKLKDGRKKLISKIQIVTLGNFDQFLWNGIEIFQKILLNQLL